MGLFGRKKNADGFYTGDAPVNAPGFDGAEPGAYLGMPSAEPAGADSRADSRAEWRASPNPAPSLFGGATIDPVATAPPPVDSALPPPAGTGSAAGGVIPRTIDPATAARIQRALSGSSSNSHRGLLILLPVIGALIAVGASVFVALHAFDSVTDALPEIAAQGAASAGEQPRASLTALGEPVAVTTRDAAYQLTVFGAVTQPGDGWGYARAGADPVLVVEAQIARTDSGAEPVEFTGWNWFVTDASGTATSGNIISHYEPSLDGPSLIGGQSVRGYVTFDTPATEVALAVSDGPARTSGPLAVWTVSAARPEVVAGNYDAPALAEISRPGFTVTIGEPEVVGGDEERIGYRPASGRYLTFPVEFAGVPGTSGHLGIIDSERFVLVPDDAPSIFPAFNGVDGAFSFVSLDASRPERGFLAFDTVSTSGELQLRDDADRVILTWDVG